VHPARRATDLDRTERGHLLAGIRRVLRTAVRDGRVLPRRTWLAGRRDRERPDCPRAAATCGTGRSAGAVRTGAPSASPSPDMRASAWYLPAASRPDRLAERLGPQPGAPEGSQVNARGETSRGDWALRDARPAQLRKR
jgi:hypothetical protein